MVLVDPHRISPVPWYSGDPLGQLPSAYRAFTFCGAAFQAASTWARGPVVRVLQPRYGRNRIGLGSSPFARHYLGNHTAIRDRRLVFSSSRYCDVSVPRVSRCRLCVGLQLTGLQPAGFPHSEIRGSTLVCSSPRLIAAYHVLHRLSMPRHPPYALLYLSPTHRTRI